MDQRDALDELFTTSLDAFVETRARLAAALLAAGRKDDAQALKKVRRPSPSAWATNQVVRRARAEVDAFLEASDRLRGSQGAIVAGRGDRGVYQADAEDLRRATAALTDAARRILAELGRADDRPVVERVLANARAAALTDAARQALLEGALLADLDGGVDAFGGLLSAPPPASGAAPPARAPATPPARPASGPSARDQRGAAPRAGGERARGRAGEGARGGAARRGRRARGLRDGRRRLGAGARRSTRRDAAPKRRIRPRRRPRAPSTTPRRPTCARNATPRRRRRGPDARRGAARRSKNRRAFSRRPRNGPPRRPSAWTGAR